MADLLYLKNIDEHYAVFTMNRPERLNALGGTMERDLEEALRDFTSDHQMRVGILTGAGRAFCAGGDLKEMAERNASLAEIEASFERREITSEEYRRQRASLERAIEGSPEKTFPFSSNPKPFIAAINGLCLAGGFERSLDCDIRIASTEAYFGLFEVKRGIIAPYAIQNAPRVMPFGEVMYLVLTGETMSVQDAYRIGYVHEIVEPKQLMLRAVQIAAMIAANAPLAVQGSKALAQVWRQFGMGESQRVSSCISRVVLASDDVKEGSRAFAEKRPPVWRGH